MDAPVAVTGATGFLGGHIVDALLASGHRVRAVVRNPSRATSLAARGVEVREARLQDAAALAQAIEGARAVVSNAALGSWAGPMSVYREVNIAGTDNLLDAMEATGVARLVHISSVAVGRTRTRAWTDENVERVGRDGVRGPRQASDLTTDWRYAVSKSVSEDRVRARAPRLQPTILRPGPVYGVGDPKLTRRYLKMWRSKVCLAPTAGVPHVCASDVAGTVVVALARPQTIDQTYVLAGPPVSPLSVLRSLKRLSGRGPILLPLPVPTWVGFTTHRAARDLDFVSRPVADVLADVLRAEGVTVRSGTRHR